MEEFHRDQCIISAVAAQVIRVPPITLLADERDRLYNRSDSNLWSTREVERGVTLGRWQEELNNQSTTGTWTKKLIKNIKSLIRCPHERANYFLTQFFMGHGRFGSSQHKMAIATDNR